MEAWNTDTLCGLAPRLLHPEPPDTDTLVLVHGSRL